MSMDKIMEDRKEVVEKIATDIEAGKPLFWESGLTVSGRPRNIMQRSGRASYYRGGNSLRLFLCCDAARLYRSPLGHIQAGAGDGRSDQKGRERHTHRVLPV